MKVNWLHILLFILIGALGAWFLIDHISQTRQVKYYQRGARDNLALYFACRDAKQSAQTIRSTDTVYSVIPAKPSPEVIKISDTGCYSVYSDLYSFDRIKFWYRIGIKNCRITDIVFPKIIYPVDTIKIRYAIDTCVNKPPERIDLRRSRLGVWFGTGINNLREFPQFSVGGFWFYKDFGYISPGVMFDARQGRIYGVINIGINLRK
jgi:hypothetical protein